MSGVSGRARRRGQAPSWYRVILTLSVYHILNKCFRRASAASWYRSLYWLHRPLERAEPQKGKRGRGPLLGTQSHEHQIKTRPGRCGRAIYNIRRDDGSEGLRGLCTETSNRVIGGPTVKGISLYIVSISSRYETYKGSIRIAERETLVV